MGSFTCAAQAGSVRIESLVTNNYDIAILGAGCAGMTLAKNLASGGYTGSVIVIDKRQSFDQEQRWCTWGPLEPDLTRLSSHHWDSARITVDTAETMLHSPGAPYYHFYAPDYFADALAMIQKSDAIKIALNHQIIGIHRDDASGRWRCETDHGAVLSKIILDARNIESIVTSKAVAVPWLWQSFAGQVIESTSPLFEPTSMTLMDFNVPGGQEGAFVYILPFDTHTALVESTLISKRSASQDEHIALVETYVRQHFGVSHSVRSVEYGNIPMTTMEMKPHRGDGYFALGISGGAAKPSTGYAFMRIQKQCRTVAEDLIKFGQPIERKSSAAERRRKWLDNVFITAADSDDGFFTRIIEIMAKKLPDDLFVRFLSERTSAYEDFAVMQAVGNKQLIKAAIRISSNRV